jgi:hypothetical protein
LSTTNDDKKKKKQEKRLADNPYILKGVKIKRNSEKSPTPFSRNKPTPKAETTPVVETPPVTEQPQTTGILSPQQRPARYGFETAPSDNTASETTTPITQQENIGNMLERGTAPVNDKRMVGLNEDGTPKTVDVETSTPQLKLNQEDYSSELDANGKVILPKKRVDNSIENKVKTATYNSLIGSGLEDTPLGEMLGSALAPIFRGLETMQRGNKETKVGRELTDNLIGLSQIGIGSIPSMIGVNSITPIITKVSGDVAESIGLDRQGGEKVGQIASFAPFGVPMMLAGLTSETAGEFVHKILADRDMDEADKERLVEIASQVGFFGGLGLTGVTKRVYQKVRNIADLKVDGVKKLTPEEIESKLAEAITQEKEKAIVDGLKQDKEVTLEKIKTAETPEERLKAIDTLEKIEVKEKEIREQKIEKEKIKKEKVVGNQDTRRATTEVPEQRTYDSAVDDFFQAKENKEPLPLVKDSDFVDYDKGKVNNLNYQISQHNLNIAKETGDFSLVNPDYVNTGFRNIEGQVKKLGVKPIEKKVKEVKPVEQPITETPKIEISKDNLIETKSTKPQEEALSKAKEQEVVDFNKKLTEKIEEPKTSEPSPKKTPSDVVRPIKIKEPVKAEVKNESQTESVLRGNLNGAVEQKQIARKKVQELNKQLETEPLNGKRAEINLELLKWKDKYKQSILNEKQFKEEINKFEKPQEIVNEPKVKKEGAVPTPKTERVPTKEISYEITKTPDGKFEVTAPDGTIKSFRRESNAEGYVNSLKHEANKQIVLDALKKDSGISFTGLSKLGDIANPKVIKAVYDIAKHHTGKFVEWARKVIKDVGDWVRPHLRDIWTKIKTPNRLENVTTLGFNFSKKKTEKAPDFDYSQFTKRPRTRESITERKVETERNTETDPKVRIERIRENIKSFNENPVHSDGTPKLTDAIRKKLLQSDTITKGSKPAKKDKFNYNKFSTEQEVNKLIQDSSNKNKAEVDKYKRDIRTWADTERGADLLKQINWDKKSLMAYTKGDSLLAERIIRSKDIIDNEGRELLKLMKETPTDGNATDNQKVALANKFLEYNALVVRTKGMISEAGRALNVVKRQSKGDIQNKIDLAGEIQRLGLDPNSVESLSKVIKILEPTYKDAFWYALYNSMLSNPLTDVANTVGNATHFGWETFRTVMSQKPSDSIAMLSDLKDASKEGWGEMKKIFQGQERVDSKFDYNAKKYQEVFTPTSKTGKVVKALLPTTRLSAEDAFFRAMFGGLRKRKTIEAISKETGDPFAQVISTLEAVYQNPELATLDKKFEIYDKHLTALEKFIDYGVFQQPLGGLGQWWQNGAKKYVIGGLMIPFARIAVNMTKVGLRGTPYGLKDLISIKTNESGKFTGFKKKELTPLERKDIVTRAIMGTTFFAGLAGLMANDLIEITGHGVDDKDKRELWHKQGYKENHFYVNIDGEKYGFSYQNINPINTILGLIGNYHDDLKYNQTTKDGQRSFVEKTEKAILGMVQNLTTQSFMSGLADILKSIENKDPDKIEKALTNFITPSGLGFVRDVSNYVKGEGKTQYETNSYLDRLKDKTGLTEGLKPKLNQFGEPMTTPLNRFPLPVSKIEADSPLTSFLADNEIEVGFPQKFKVKNGDITDEQFYEYQKLAGEKVKTELTKRLPYLNKLKTKELKDKATHKIVDDIREQVRTSIKNKKQ